MTAVALFADAVVARPPRLSWSRELPKEVATGAAAKHRTAYEVDEFFAHALRVSEEPTIRTIIARFGDPDAFSPEGYYKGGTLRWLLRDGGDLQVVTDEAFQAIFWASRFDMKGRNKFLWK
jgi:hypothetical protein